MRKLKETLGNRRYRFIVAREILTVPGLVLGDPLKVEARVRIPLGLLGSGGVTSEEVLPPSHQRPLASARPR